MPDRWVARMQTDSSKWRRVDDRLRQQSVPAVHDDQIVFDSGEMLESERIGLQYDNPNAVFDAPRRHIDVSRYVVLGADLWRYGDNGRDLSSSGVQLAQAKKTIFATSYENNLRGWRFCPHVLDYYSRLDRDKDFISRFQDRAHSHPSRASQFQTTNRGA